MLPLKLCPPWNEISDVHDEPSVKTSPTPTSNPQTIVVGLTQRPLTTPRLLLRLWWGLFADFPLGGQRLPKRHEPADPAVSCPVHVYGPQPWPLPGYPVSLWVVCLASRELARPCRPSDMFTSRRRQRVRSVEKFLPTSGLLSPQNPHARPLQTTGIPERGIQCI